MDRLIPGISLGLDPPVLWTAEAQPGEPSGIRRGGCDQIAKRGAADRPIAVRSERFTVGPANQVVTVLKGDFDATPIHTCVELSHQLIGPNPFPRQVVELRNPWIGAKQIFRQIRQPVEIRASGVAGDRRLAPLPSAEIVHPPGVFRTDELHWK